MRIGTISLFVALLLLACSGAPGPPGDSSTPAQPPPVRVTFVPESDSFAAAAQEYEQIWGAEGPQIIAAMESVSGLQFTNPIYADTAITVIMLEQAASSGYREHPMHMRASYPPSTKRATLVHELGHRLQSNLFRYGEDNHDALFLWLYDVWVELYGRPFADGEVDAERRRGGRYPAAWDAAMALAAEERAMRWRAIVTNDWLNGVAAMSKVSRTPPFLGATLREIERDVGG